MFSPKFYPAGVLKDKNAGRKDGVGMKRTMFAAVVLAAVILAGRAAVAITSLIG